MRRFFTLLAALIILPSATWAADAILCPYDSNFFTLQSPFLAMVGIVLLVLEFLLPTKGFLGILGVLSFIMGTSNLVNSPCPAWQLSWPVVLLLNVVVIGTFITFAYLTFRGYTSNKANEIDPLIGHQGLVIEWNENAQRVDIGGTIWQAQSPFPLVIGQKIVVTGQQNLTLFVKPPGV